MNLHNALLATLLLIPGCATQRMQNATTPDSGADAADGASPSHEGQQDGSRPADDSSVDSDRDDGGNPRDAAVAAPADDSGAGHDGNAAHHDGTAGSDACAVEGCEAFLCVGGRRLIHLADNLASVTAADLDGDPLIDLVFTGGAHGIMALRNEGDGTFADPIEYDWFGKSIAVADLNGDGIADFALKTDAGATLLLNDGHGGFQESQYNIGTGSADSAGPDSILVSDLNDDDLPDVAFAAQGRVAMVANQGHGTFARADGDDTFPVLATQANSDVFSLTAADFDGDGKGDLAAVDFTHDTLYVGLHRRDENPNMMPTNVYTTGKYPNSVAAADLNGDGSPDLAIANYGSDDVSVFINDGEGKFAGPTNYPGGFRPGEVVAGDLNHDGSPDLAVGNDGSSVSVLLNHGDGAFIPVVNYAAGARPAALVIADFDQDNRTDLVVANYNGDLNLFVVADDGVLPSPVAYVTPRNPASFAVADFSGDGFPDVAAASKDTNGITFLLNRGDGSMLRSTNYLVGVMPVELTAGDLNGDDKMDLLFISGTSGIGIALQQTDGLFVESKPYLVAGTGPVAVALGDLDQDHDLDLVVANSSSNDVSTLFGHGDGTFDAAVATPVGTSPTTIVVSDLDGDAAPDIVVTNAESDDVTVLLNQGDGAWKEGKDYAVGNWPKAVAAADLNADGAPDLAVANSHSDDVTILLNDGKGGFKGSATYAASNEPSSVSTGDMDGDGKVDIVVSNLGSYRLTFLKNLGGAKFAAPIEQSLGITAHLDPASSSLPVAVVSDLDLDGSPDVAMVNPDSNNVSVTLNRCY